MPENNYNPIYIVYHRLRFSIKLRFIILIKLCCSFALIRIQHVFNGCILNYASHHTRPCIPRVKLSRKQATMLCIILLQKYLPLFPCFFFFIPFAEIHLECNCWMSEIKIPTLPTTNLPLWFQCSSAPTMTTTPSWTLRRHFLADFHARSQTFELCFD